MKVFLVCSSAHSSCWTELTPRPLFYCEDYLRTYSFPKAVYSLAGTEGCEVEWLRYDRPSPLPESAKKWTFGHGEQFELEGKSYLVYLEREDASWLDHAPAGLEDRVICLRLQSEEVGEAALRFLHLPYVKEWWLAEYSRLTSFTLCRNGVIPALKTCQAEVGESQISLTWEVRLYDLFDQQWLESPLTISRSVAGQELRLLDQCTHLLSSL